MTKEIKITVRDFENFKRFVADIEDRCDHWKDWFDLDFVIEVNDK